VRKRILVSASPWSSAGSVNTESAVLAVFATFSSLTAYPSKQPKRLGRPPVSQIETARVRREASHGAMNDQPPAETPAETPTETPTETPAETYSPWTVVNLVFAHLVEEGLHPTLGSGGSPGEPAADLLRVFGIHPSLEGDTRIGRATREKLAELRATMDD
jgi:hypothetical protein